MQEQQVLIDMDNYEWCELYSALGEQLDIKSMQTFAAATIPALRLHKRDAADIVQPLSA